MRRIIPLFSILFWTSCSVSTIKNAAELLDNNASTAYIAEKSSCRLSFDGFTSPIKSYKIYSSGEKSECDPDNWILYGLKNGKWIEIDRREGVKFCSRYQENVGVIASPDNYTAYRFDFSTASDTKVAIGDISFFNRNVEAKWEHFKYPEVHFEITDPATEGAKFYTALVQDPREYVRYHTRKVAEILFFTADDPMNTVERINYFLKDYDGVSYKDGTPAETTVVYSTRHIERSAAESMYKLDYETRGVLYHELCHAYQFEPKGIGSYGTNKENWACIEGVADAVRTEAGLFDVKALRKPGGNWMDGYKTTGFFIQWLTTKDPDAIRKFHLTVRDLNPWSFDGAIRSMFGQSIEEVWNEYQEYLLKEQAE